MDDGGRDQVGYYFGRTMSEPTRVKVSPPRDSVSSAHGLNPAACNHCGEPVFGYIPHRCPGSERVALASAIAEAIILLERNGYEVRRKDAPPVADEADQAAMLASNAQGVCWAPSLNSTKAVREFPDGS